MRVPCDGEDCDKYVDPNAVGTYREVTGWEQVRGQGGANVIHDRRETGRVLCQGCYRDQKVGGGTRPML